MSEKSKTCKNRRFQKTNKEKKNIKKSALSPGPWSGKNQCWRESDGPTPRPRRKANPNPNLECQPQTLSLSFCGVAFCFCSFWFLRLLRAELLFSSLLLGGAAWSPASLGGVAVFSFSFCGLLARLSLLWVVVLFSSLRLGGAAWSPPPLGGVACATFSPPVGWCSRWCCFFSLPSPSVLGLAPSPRRNIDDPISYTRPRRGSGLVH